MQQLQQHLKKACAKAEKSVPGSAALHQRRVHFHPETLDLLSLLSVQKLCKRLRDYLPKLDVVICNAGIGGWDDLDWGTAVWSILTKWKTAVTWPTYKRSGRGWVTKPQLPPKNEKGKATHEPPLGEVFCANIFGHYLMGHYLAPLLEYCDETKQTRGRLIWVSSLEAYGHSFNPDDMQGLLSEAPYESTKRQTDLMAITSALPSTTLVVNQYLNRTKDADEATKPRIYVTHPGICGTSIFPLNAFLDFCMLVVFYVARWMGSIWHPITAYKGAVAIVWIALAKQATLDSMEEQEGIGKWGSATDFFGDERVERTEIDGWGWGGKLGERTNRRGRSPYAKKLTKEAKEDFEEQGKKCWEMMEQLRFEWEKRLEDAGVAVMME